MYNDEKLPLLNSVKSNTLTIYRNTK